MKVSELFNLKKVKGDVGIEIECEGKGFHEVDNAVWRTEHDGSLRGEYPRTCAEFILARPIPVAAVEDAIIGLKNELEGAEFNFSYRTSVHVHVNVQDMEWQQLCAMLYAYYLLEEPLMTYAGKIRKGNNFCLRLQDAEGVLDTIVKFFENGENAARFIRQDQIRYSAMNVEALKKYGSVEFRGMEGNIDSKRISSLCTALVNLREYARNKETPEAVYERFIEAGPVQFMDEVIGKEFTYPRAERDILTSFSISLDLPFAFKRFKEKPVLKKADLKNPQVGDVVSHDEAVQLLRKNPAYQFDPIDDGMYMVSRIPEKVRAVRKVGMAMPVQAVIVDDFE